YDTLGQERPIFSNVDYAHPSAFRQNRCDPASTECIRYTRSKSVRPMLGDSGWCNPPFVNMAVEVSYVYAPGRSTSLLIEAHSAEDLNSFKIGHHFWRYTANAVALACPDAYIAVQDVYWTGFQYPLYRAVVHLGKGRFSREEHPDCWEHDKRWNEDFLKRSCLERFFDGFGRPNPPVSFAELEALYSAPITEAERQEILSAVAPPLVDKAESAETPLIHRFTQSDNGEWTDLLNNPMVEDRVAECRPSDSSDLRSVTQDSRLLAAYKEYLESVTSVQLVSLTLTKIFVDEPEIVQAFQEHINGYSDVYRGPLSDQKEAMLASACDALPGLLDESTETLSAFARHMFQFVRVYSDARGIANWRDIISR
ncbi:MAG: hypothetical protein AAF636_27250, partial [Pseudomonadota bacterium]